MTLVPREGLVKVQGPQESYSTPVELEYLQEEGPVLVALQLLPRTFSQEQLGCVYVLSLYLFLSPDMLHGCLPRASRPKGSKRRPPGFSRVCTLLREEQKGFVQ